MSNQDQPGLFGPREAPDETSPLTAPLATRMRPQSLDEFVHASLPAATQRIIHGLAGVRRFPSLVLYGPPGSGKTTLALLLAQTRGFRLETLSATQAGVTQLREVAKQAFERHRSHAQATMLFVDEIHRFSRAQQDALLPHVESGRITLIGATTEHPGLQINAALLSRVRVVELSAMSPKDLVSLMKRALCDKPRGLAYRPVQIDDELLADLARAVGGDARRGLNTLELAVDLLEPDEHELKRAQIDLALGEYGIRYDRSGQEHYNLASAFIKSMRASDIDASVYWMVRMLESGEDPLFVARRLVIFASEDVGNADPQALVLATSAMQATSKVGMPEAVLCLTQTCLYLAMAPKSNTALSAYAAARKDVRSHGALEVPLSVRNAVTSLMKAQGYGQGYRYPHDLAPGEQGPTSYLPAPLQGASTRPGARYLQDKRLSEREEQAYSQLLRRLGLGSASKPS